MFRIYLKDYSTGGIVAASKTNTGNANVAIAAFFGLVNDTQYDGERIAAVLSWNNQQVAFHRFDWTERGYDELYPDYWRGYETELQEKLLNVITGK